ncbi:hypothetical protein [Actinokineospora spheciospongiae]|uniref:hypothetical protein n=1 Tax=Actinokineospora spheciospongiae TaxID=909613 RepID=UPI000D71081E|nr:hypothetical protein [Actinokineospora spheciospongiae]PWW51934.1 hypothetical protein DFQ13_11929 [Actinokineospora spheciospongiae]
MASQKKRRNRKRNRHGGSPTTSAAYAARPPREAESGTRVALVIAAVVGWIALFPLFWFVIAPALSDAVGTVPVLDTIVGWLPGGLAMVYTGVLVMFWDEIPQPRQGVHATTAIVLGAIGLVTFPGLDAEAMHIGYFAGIYASILSMIAWLPAFGVVALARRPFTSSWEIPRRWKGATIIGAAVLMLFLGAGVMRTWF